MKILSILTYYHPHWTGLTAYAKRIAEGLAARGHPVTVLTTQHDRALPKEEVFNGVRIVRVPPAGHFSRGVITPTFPWVAARLIRESDVVQIHTPLPESLIVATLCRFYKRSLLMTHHGDLVMPTGFVNQLTERIGVALMTQTERMASRISIHSRDYAENSDFLWPFAPKLAYIYPPIEIPEPQPEAFAAWRKELGVENKKLIGFAGRFVEEKGFDYLLQAIPAVLQAEPNAHWVYAGELHVVYERFFERWKHLIDKHREHISIAGLIRDQQRLANLYAMCDVFTIPSRTDCFPSVQIEAMLCGTPLVTSDIPGAREPVQVTGMGRLVAPNNPAALAEGLIDVLRNPARYTKSRAQIRQVFNTARTLDEYEALMAELAGLPKPAPRAQPLPPPAPKPAVPIVRYRNGTLPSDSLTKQDHEILNPILRNEADMAYRRRVRILLDYLELKDGDRVFDCGCGMGFYSMAMSKLRKLRLVGLDGDVERLHWAQREQVPSSLLSGNIEILPFASESFDKVLMTEVLEHLRDDRRGLHEILRVLKPGGILSLSVPNTNYPFWWDPFNRTITALGGDPIRKGWLAGIWSNHERLYRVEEVIDRMQEAGFKIEIAEEITHYSFPFIHFLVYGIGKPLIERNMLPTALRKSADRFSGEKNSGSMLNPINLGLAAFRAVDRLNDRSSVAQKKNFVSILIKARKPG